MCICSLHSALLRILHPIRANRGHLASGDSNCDLYRCIGIVICPPPVDNGQWKLFGSIRSGLGRSGSSAPILGAQRSTDLSFFTCCADERLGLQFCLSGGLISPFVCSTHPEHLHESRNGLRAIPHRAEKVIIKNKNITILARFLMTIFHIA